MNYDYVITLRRPDYKAINIISQLLILLFVIAFVRFGLEVGFSTIKVQCLIPLAVTGLWGYTAFRKKEKNFVPYYRLALLLAGLGWMYISAAYNWSFAILYFALGMAERFIKFPDEIGFSKETVVRNTFPKRKYEWVDIENAIIRDNFFTLDLRNNKIIQKELDEPVSKELEAEFNQFCKEQLHFSLMEENKQ